MKICQPILAHLTERSDNPISRAKDKAIKIQIELICEFYEGPPPDSLRGAKYMSHPCFKDKSPSIVKT